MLHLYLCQLSLPPFFLVQPSPFLFGQGLLRTILFARIATGRVLVIAVINVAALPLLALVITKVKREVSEVHRDD